MGVMTQLVEYVHCIVSVQSDGFGVADMERRHRGVSTRPRRPSARNLFGCIRRYPRRFRRDGYNRPRMGCHVRVSLSPVD